MVQSSVQLEQVPGPAIFITSSLFTLITRFRSAPQQGSEEHRHHEAGVQLLKWGPSWRLLPSPPGPGDPQPRGSRFTTYTTSLASRCGSDPANSPRGQLHASCLPAGSLLPISGP